jgi:hypothetical protein
LYFIQMVNRQSHTHYYDAPPPAGKRRAPRQVVTARAPLAFIGTGVVPVLSVVAHELQDVLALLSIIPGSGLILDGEVELFYYS